MIATYPKTLYFQGFSGFFFDSGTRKVHGGYTKNLCESLQTVGNFPVFCRVQVEIDLQSCRHALMPEAFADQQRCKTELNQQAGVGRRRFPRAARSRAARRRCFRAAPRGRIAPLR